jgi:uncharacterized protein
MKQYTFLLFLALAVSLSAQEYSVNDVPNPRTTGTNNFVSNPDGILSYATVEQINATLQSLETDTKAEINVVMLNSIGSKDIFDFGVQLFNKWGIGKEKLDNGLLILFVLDQRTVRFEVGYGLEGILPDGICKRIQTQAMIPEFKNGDYDAGILAGVEWAAAYIRQEPVPEENVSSSFIITTNSVAITIIVIYLITMIILFLEEKKKIKKITDNPSLTSNKQRYKTYTDAKSKSIEGCLLFGSGCMLPFLGSFILLFAGAHIWAIGLAVLLIPATFVPLSIYQSKWKKKFRRQPFPCPSCDKEINVLPKKENNKYLDPQANLETALKSVYTDVFLCEDCGKTIIYKYDNAHSKYKKCSQCGTVAMHVTKTVTIIRATYQSGGLKQETYICKYCLHQKTEEKKTPRLNSSSGGSSGRSGSGGSSSSRSSGGRSGGGGSSSRW